MQQTTKILGKIRAAAQAAGLFMLFLTNDIIVLWCSRRRRGRVDLKVPVDESSDDSFR